MCINATPITADGEPLDSVEDFTYLDNLVATDNATLKDIKARLGKVPGARRRPVWKSKLYILRTKPRLYNSIDKPILLYGAECWWVVKSDMDMINDFHDGCLQRISSVSTRSQTKNSTRKQRETGDQTLSNVIVQSWTCSQNGPGQYHRQTPPGKRKQGWPRTTWQRTVVIELKEQHTLKDRQIVDASCHSGHKEK